MYYRLYLLNDLGGIMRAEEIVDVTEDQAVREAQLHPHPYGRELWRGDKRIVQLDGRVEAPGE